MMLPDAYCASCQVLWDASISNKCWVCDAKGTKPPTAATDEEHADYTIQRVIQLHRI